MGLHSPISSESYQTSGGRPHHDRKLGDREFRSLFAASDTEQPVPSAWIEPVTVRGPRVRTAPRNCRANPDADPCPKSATRCGRLWHGAGIGCDDVVAVSVQG